MTKSPLNNVSSFVQLMRQIKNTLPAEKLRFVQNPNMQFPQKDFAKIAHNEAQQQLTVLTNFLGLLGATGVMPVHYTEEILHQLKAKNYAQKEFYDIFHQRIIELFYAADQALAPIIDADATNFKHIEQSAIQHYLCDLLGINYQLENSALQHNSFYANPTPSAAKLAQILRANTLLNIDVQQNRAVSETIPEQYCNQLSNNASINMLLDETFVLGDRARLDHVYFLIIVNAENFAEFVRLQCDKNILQIIQQHARAYAGNAFKFNVEIKLEPKLIEPMYLEQRSYLGASFC